MTRTKARLEVLEQHAWHKRRQPTVIVYELDGQLYDRWPWATDAVKLSAEDWDALGKDGRDVWKVVFDK